MRIITVNLNGIRSAAKKGFFEWMQQQSADVICLQELKAQEADMHADFVQPQGYYGYFHFAEKKGYSGVGIYTRKKPEKISTGLGWSFADTEGRYVEADFGKYVVASLYLPSGTSGEERQAVKFDFLKRYADIIKKQISSQKKYIICGDFNIAHKNMDLKNWRGNQKNSGFLPEERAWLDELFGSIGLVDAFREVNQEENQYTWWSHRGQAWAKNVGWRIDYQVITPDLKVKSAAIYKDQRFSDHAPLIIDYHIDSFG
jgi:exodeoxyribonuclease-3